MIARSRLISCLLAGALLLSLCACSSRGNTLAPPSPSAAPTPGAAGTAPGPESLLPDDFTADPEVEDLCLATLGVPGGETFLTVDGRPISGYQYLHWLIYNITYLEDNLAYYGQGLDLMTDADLALHLKEEARDAAVWYDLVAAKAEELGYGLTQEQLKTFEDNIALSQEMAGGEEAFLDELRMNGMDYDAFYQIYSAPYYYVQLRDGLFAGRPTDEEMRAYIEENDLLRAKHILLMTVDPTTQQPLDEQAAAQKKATAEDLLARLQASGDLEADFDALMNQYSEDTGLIANPDGYLFTAGQMVPEFESATRALEFGQISGLVESSYGYHIILRLDPDTEQARADCVDEMMGDQLTAWTGEAQVVPSDAYEALDVPLFYAKYTAYRQAFQAAAAAEASAAPEGSPAPSGN